MRRWGFYGLGLLGGLVVVVFFIWVFRVFLDVSEVGLVSPSVVPSSTPTPTQALLPVPARKVLENKYHVFQSFNNCGPAAFSMALSYFGVKKNQEELGQLLRPYQVPGGDNDDKSVTLEEIGDKAEEFGFAVYHRPNGNMEIIKGFIADGIPIVVRARLKEDEDIGHYRVVKGYDDAVKELLQDDSLQGHNLWYSYDLFDRLWREFNYEYLVIVPREKEEVARRILGEDLDEKKSWMRAAESAREELGNDPGNVTAGFNLSVALYNVGDYSGAVAEFEKVEGGLSFRTLWYQIEPIEAYFALGRYERVLEITERILSNQNRAFSELYVLRGRVFQKEGNLEAARGEFEKAVFYNVNMGAAREALELLRGGA